MCGRFAMDSETNELIESFVLDGNDYRDWSASYSIAPTDPVPVIRERADSATGEVRRVVEPAIWDFRPSFISKPTRPQFNARLETVAVNGMWKGAFASSRCVVPMRGYYEWTGAAGSKQPHFIHGPGGGPDAAPGEAELLAAAGLLTVRKVDGQWEVSTAIITREGVDASGEVHDRMPVFLTPGAYDRWLEPRKLTDDAERQEMLDLLASVSAEVAATITTYEVDRRVNSTRAVDPADATLIAPLPAG